MTKTCDTERVSRPGNNVHIPLTFEEAIRGLLKGKPTKEMPRPGAKPTKAKKQTAKAKKRAQDKSG